MNVTSKYRLLQTKLDNREATIAAQAAEIERLKAENAYLRHFRRYADFGPAQSDVVAYINAAYVAKGNVSPDGWGEEE